jgi:hypothetical protein
MAHFAELDEQNVVTQVVVVHNDELLDHGIESEAKGIAFLQSLFGHGRWKQTSYNGSRRKHYAGCKYTYDQHLDAFIPPRPFPSWSLDESSCQWVPPVPMPEDSGQYLWDEDTQSWKALDN